MSVGEVLARARHDAHLSVEEVAADTRIRATLIRSIEADEFDPCGGSVYARGHIRSIARVVGIDPEPLIVEYDRDHDIPPVPVSVAATPTDPDIVARTTRRGPNWAAAMAVALAVICVLALVGLLHKGGGSSNNPQAGVTTTNTPRPSSKPPASTPPSSVAELASDHKATMLIRTTHGQTWLSVKTKSGATLFSGLLEDGKSKLFTDRHGLVFVIGNVPAVDVVVNGHDIGSPHSATVVLRGQVVPGSDTLEQT